MRALLILRQSGTIRTVELGEYRVFTVGQPPALEQTLYRDAHPVGRLMTIYAGSSVGSQRGKERMAFGVHGPRRVNHAERSFDAVKGVELRQDGAAAGLDPGDLEAVLVLGAQRERDPKDDNDKERSAHRKGCLRTNSTKPAGLVFEAPFHAESSCRPQQISGISGAGHVALRKSSRPPLLTAGVQRRAACPLAR